MTGCGPTAIAIAMRARMWPDEGEGTIPSYTTETEQITVPERELGTPYDWTNMPLTDGADEEKNSWNSAQKAEVARLIADIGAATEADYSPESTGIFGYIVPAALSTYMKYDKSIYEAMRDYYSEKEWYPLIKREILNNPVIYSGFSQLIMRIESLEGRAVQTALQYFMLSILRFIMSSLTPGLAASCMRTIASSSSMPAERA